MGCWMIILMEKENKMIAIIFIILSVCWLVFGLWVVINSFNDSSYDDLAPLGAIIILIVIGLNGLQMTIHISDISLVKNQHIVLQVREDAITRINNDLKDFPQTTTLMNADSPIRSMIETKSQYISDLTNTKVRIADAKMSIERRKLGSGAWAVWLMGDGHE